MNKIFIALILAVLSIGTAHAQAGFPTPPYTAQGYANGCGLTTGPCSSMLANSSSYITNATGTIAASGSTTNINVTSGYDINMQGVGQVTNPLPSVITPATSYPTHAATTPITARYNIIAAGGPTAMYVLLPTGASLSSNVKTIGIINNASNPVAIVPNSTDTLNIAAAATPYSCATDKYCECSKVAAGAFRCTSQ